jgi:hypothetical protein
VVQFFLNAPRENPFASLLIVARVRQLSTPPPHDVLAIFADDLPAKKFVKTPIFPALHLAFLFSDSTMRTQPIAGIKGLIVGQGTGR